MSVYYNVKEHLVIGDIENHFETANIALSQLCLLGTWMLQDQACFDKLTVIADGEEFHFTGNTMTEDYHKAIRGLRSGASVEIISSYHYSHSAYSMDPGPFPMVEHLQEIAQNEPGELKGMFYSVYHNADCDSSAGALIAFGEKNGRVYTGEVPFETVSGIPDGDWYTPLTAVCYDTDDTEDKDIPAIMDVCRQLCNFSCADELNCSDNGSISFYLNNFQIETDAQLKSFMHLYAKLISLTDGECCLIGELADISSPDVKMLHFDVEADGTFTLEMAAISE